MISSIHQIVLHCLLTFFLFSVFSGEELSQIDFFQWVKKIIGYSLQKLAIKISAGSVLHILTEQETQVISRIKVC